MKQRILESQTNENSYLITIYYSLNGLTTEEIQERYKFNEVSKTHKFIKRQIQEHLGKDLDFYFFVEHHKHKREETRLQGYRKSYKTFNETKINPMVKNTITGDYEYERYIDSDYVEGHLHTHLILTRFNDNLHTPNKSKTQKVLLELFGVDYAKNLTEEKKIKLLNFLIRKADWISNTAASAVKITPIYNLDGAIDYCAKTINNVEDLMNCYDFNNNNLQNKEDLFYV